MAPVSYLALFGSRRGKKGKGPNNSLLLAAWGAESVSAKVSEDTGGLSQRGKVGKWKGAAAFYRRGVGTGVARYGSDAARAPWIAIATDGRLVLAEPLLLPGRVFDCPRRLPADASSHKPRSSDSSDRPCSPRQAVGLQDPDAERGRLTHSEG